MTVSRSREAVLCETGERRTHRKRKALFRFERWDELFLVPLRGDGTAKANRRDDADDQSADPQAARDAACEEESAGAAAEPAEARGLYPRLHDDAQEAEFGLAQSREGAAHQRIRGDWLHTGRGPQSAGALGGDNPRRPREGPARRALPHPAWCARHPRRQEPQAATLQIWSKEAEVTSASLLRSDRDNDVPPSQCREARDQPGP